jgi:hypothetical protein
VGVLAAPRARAVQTCACACACACVWLALRTLHGRALLAGARCQRTTLQGAQPRHDGDGVALPHRHGRRLRSAAATHTGTWTGVRSQLGLPHVRAHAGVHAGQYASTSACCGREPSQHARCSHSYSRSQRQLPHSDSRRPPGQRTSPACMAAAAAAAGAAPSGTGTALAVGAGRTQPQSIRKLELASWGA